MLKMIFLLNLFFIAYTYFGYPLLLKGISLFMSKKVKKANINPFITLIITAHNEEKRITAKLEETLLLKYPKNKLQILIASDSSTDDTDK